MGEPRYYQPPTTIVAVDGVRRWGSWYHDEYTGTAPALIATGLLTLGQFPGQPGLPSRTVTYRPRGGRANSAGAMRVFRNPAGTFRISIRVSDEEVERREDAARVASAQRGQRRPESINDRWLRERLDELREASIETLHRISAEIATAPGDNVLSSQMCRQRLRPAILDLIDEKLLREGGAAAAVQSMLVIARAARLR